MRKEEATTPLKKVWYFIWHEDSLLSWLANIALAFLIVYFIVYPVMGFLLSTSHPVVAVVSGSMEHDGSFGAWWSGQQQWYIKNNITEDDFKSFRFKNGFNKGDIMVLYGKKSENINIGDVLVFDGARSSPIIHRVVRKWQENGDYFFQTKGDNNADSMDGGFVNEVKISSDRVIGVAVLRIPWLGWIKIIAVGLLDLVR